MTLFRSWSIVGRPWPALQEKEMEPWAEMDTVPNSQVRHRTVMASGAPSDTESGVTFQLEQTVAVGSCTTPRQRIVRTATMDVIDPSQGLQLPQKAQPIRDSLQVEKLSARRPRTARKPPGNSRAVDNSTLLRTSSPIWQARRPAASGKWT